MRFPKFKIAGLVMVLLIVTVGVSGQDLIDIKLPAGAIIAFVDVQTCPEGWKTLDESEGRFLRGRIDSEVLGVKGGRNQHSHEGTTEPGGWRFTRQMKNTFTSLRQA